jgi:recombinational DNA repair ATPase RecF
MRLGWLLRLRETLDPIAQKIAPGQPHLAHFYLSGWVPETAGLSIANNDLDEAHFSGHPVQPSIEILEQAFWIKQSSLLESGAEFRARSTLVGPHRDDWGFALNSHGGQLLKGHGSQGEVRTALLALKLSEIELFRKRTGHRPLLLLDDFSSELDRHRREFLMNYLAETDLQVFVTSTEAPMEDIQKLGARFEIEAGKIYAAD